ncbi:hypothetical protein BN2364_0568 [Alloalcanivorax xenomutans]|nr:hypothetical protein BN2364_0568 [Alloalcanivorax xenomutans]
MDAHRRPGRTMAVNERPHIVPATVRRRHLSPEATSRRAVLCRMPLQPWAGGLVRGYLAP